MLTVGELKKLVPLQDIHEIDPNTRYLVRVTRSTSMNDVALIYQQLQAAGVNSLLIVGDDLQFYDLREKVGL